MSRNSVFFLGLCLFLFSPLAFAVPCTEFSQADLVKLDKDLSTSVEGLIHSFKKRDATALSSAFHPRMAMNRETAAVTLGRLADITVLPWEVSFHSAWSLEVSDPAQSIACGNNEFSVLPIFGFSRQLVLWLQIMGKQELARVYMLVVPFGGKWVVAALSGTQTTHLGKNALRWMQDADAQMRAGEAMAAHALADIAFKLTDGYGRLTLAQSPLYRELREKALAHDTWVERVKGLFSQDKVLAVETLFYKSGIGLLLRFELEKETPPPEVREHCSRTINTLYAQHWFQVMRGIRCSYVIKGEPTDKDGLTGSIWLDKA